MINQSDDGLVADLVAAVEHVLRRHQRAVHPPARHNPPAMSRRLTGIDYSRDTHLARTIYRSRRDRDALFGEAGELFGEGAWDILLDLYWARQEGRVVSVSSACLASAVPPTTGLRHLGRLERHDLVERCYDPFDKRRCFIALTEQCATIMDRWFARLAGEDPATSALVRP